MLAFGLGCRGQGQDSNRTKQQEVIEDFVSYLEKPEYGVDEML